MEHEAWERRERCKDKKEAESEHFGVNNCECTAQVGKVLRFSESSMTNDGIGLLPSVTCRGILFHSEEKSSPTA